MLIEAKQLFFQVASEESLLTTHQNHIVIVHLLSSAQLFATPWTAACQASLSITNSRSLPKLMSAESMMPSNHLILCCPLLLPSIIPNIRVFSSESALCIRWPKYWSFKDPIWFFSMFWVSALFKLSKLSSLFDILCHVLSPLIHNNGVF